MRTRLDTALLHGITSMEAADQLRTATSGAGCDFVRLIVATSAQHPIAASPTISMSLLLPRQRR